MIRFAVLIAFLLIGHTTFAAPAATTATGVGAGESVKLAKLDAPARTALSTQPAAPLMDVATIADLRAMAPGSTRAVHVQGYKASGDGGGGMFRYESGQPPGTYRDDGGMTILPAGGNGSAAWLRNQSGEISVKWFGATGDGITNDTEAINAAADYIRQSVKLIGGGRGVLLRFPEGTYRVRGSLNFTNIRGSRGIYWGLEGSNANILGECTGKPVFDFMRSQSGSMRGFNIEGSETFKPRCAIQLARGAYSAKGSPEVSDNFTLELIRTSGSFSLAALYNFGSERFFAYSCTFTNGDASEDSYSLVIDGRNKFGAVSDYYRNELPVNNPVSCLNQQFIKCSFQKTPGGPGGVGPAIYMTRTSRVKMIGCYAISYTNAAVVMDGDAAGFRDIDLNLHCEPSGSLRYAIRLTSSYQNNSYVIDMLRWVENSLHATTAAIYSDGPNVLLNDAGIHIGGRHGGNRPVPLFSPGEKFNVSGLVSCSPQHASIPSNMTLSGTYSPGASIRSASLPKGSFIIEDTTGYDRRMKGAQRWYGTAEGEFDGSDIGSQSVAAVEDGALFLGHSEGQPDVTFGDPLNERPKIQLQAFDSASALRFRVTPDGGITWTPSFTILSSGAVRQPGLPAAPKELSNGGDSFYNTTAHSFQAYKGGSSPTWGDIPITLRGSASLNFPSTPAHSGSDLTIAVSGAANGDEVIHSVPAGAVLPNSCYSAFVASDNTVTVRFNNYSNSAQDPPSGTFRISIIKR